MIVITLNYTIEHTDDGTGDEENEDSKMQYNKMLRLTCSNGDQSKLSKLRFIV